MPRGNDKIDTASRPVSDIAFTPSVKAFQEHMGSRENYEMMEQQGGWKVAIVPQLSNFIAKMDTFFLGTVNAEGQPYIQHRGGPKGFLKVLDETTLAFGDFEGNRQYITAGNLADNDKAFIFLLDTAHRRRIKIWGRAEVIENDPTLLARFTDPDYGYEPTRVIRFHIDAWDVNCPQHITPRFTEEEIEQRILPLKERIAELEQILETKGNLK
jgi:predicted pyridoxine 5'-phosphate oxidase superfamily flavin-nucleotide-binding protein